MVFVRSVTRRPQLGGYLDQEVVELPTEGPTDVDGVVLYERLKFLVGKLFELQRSPQMVAYIRVGPYGGRATDADDAAVASGQIRVARPDLPVEEVERGV